MTMCVIEACSSRSTLTCSGSRVHSSTRHCGISCTAASLTQLPISPLHSQQHLQCGMCSSRSCPARSVERALWHVQQQHLLCKCSSICILMCASASKWHYVSRVYSTSWHVSSIVNASPLSQMSSEHSPSLNTLTTQGMVQMMLLLVRAMRKDGRQSVL